ncbi:MAG: GFA family protein [Proteobacteria bacterium]|nr:GFA family protein [Pseudomonadota bacterium]
MIHGHCECGLVSFEADCEISDFSHCHCSQCRRLHGAAFATFAEVETKKFHYVIGEDKIKVYASSDDYDRVFCGTCGSNILVLTKSYPDYLYLSMGLVDGNPDHPKEYHQFVGSKAPWHEITDDAEQYEGAPPE